MQPLGCSAQQDAQLPTHPPTNPSIPAQLHHAQATVVVSGAPKVERYGTESTKIGNNYTRPEGQNVGNVSGRRAGA